VESTVHGFATKWNAEGKFQAHFLKYYSAYSVPNEVGGTKLGLS